MLKTRVDKTEGTYLRPISPIWIFNFWPYGQLRTVRRKNPKSSFFSCLHEQIFLKDIVASALKSCICAENPNNYSTKYI